MNDSSTDLSRVLGDLVIGSENARKQRRDDLATIKSGEYDQQVEVPFSGSATSTWGYQDIKMSWEHPIVYAPLQRDPQFETPHITDHISLSGKETSLVIVVAHLIAWNYNERGWFVGATMRLAAQAPLTNAEIAYSGMLFATFQGMAFPTDEGDTGST